MTAIRLCVDCAHYARGQCSRLKMPASMARYAGACGAAGTYYRRPGVLGWISKVLGSIWLQLMVLRRAHSL